MVTVILVGGSSRRMGRDKATLSWHGDTLCQSLIGKYAGISESVSFSSDRPGRFSFQNAVEIIDRFPGMGPLNGLVSAFDEFDCEDVFLTGTDIPFGDPGLVLKLLSLIGEHEACIIKHGTKGMEPLFAVYRRKSGEKARQLLLAGRRSFRDLIDTVNVRFVSAGELSGFDLDRILTNVNTLEEYESSVSGEE